ncbi:MAG: PTS sugar transporter subunit IIA [Alphaproteobacteria bacterium]|nr:PTS sugar transporter subunit IIA [Alphaproteobacteria bacterium]
MIGLVLVTHGGLADEFLAALEHVVGPQTHVAAVSIGPDDDMDQRRQDIFDAVNEVNQGSGVVVLTDMFGGTPSNLAIKMMESAAARKQTGGIEVISGVNLPMLIKLASARADKPLGELVEEAQDAGRKYINIASALLQRD